MNTLYLATSDGPIIVTGEKDRWSARRPLELRSELGDEADLYPFISADLMRPERVFFGSWEHGVWRSDDAGRTWRRVFKGLPHERITAVAVSPTERVGGHGVVYVGTEPSAIFRSEDSGETWRECPGLSDLPSADEWSFPPRPDTHHVRWIEPDLHVPGRVFVAVEAGALIWTPDGGQTWHDRTEDGPEDTHQLASHPDAPGRLWSAGGYGFYESHDAGRSWRHYDKDLRFNYCYSVAVDPADPATAVMTASPGPTEAYSSEGAESAIFRRTADGPWQEIRAGLPPSKGTRVPVVATHRAEPGVFYCAAESALYRSSDAGATWRMLDVDWPDGQPGERIHAVIVVRMNSGG